MVSLGRLTSVKRPFLKVNQVDPSRPKGFISSSWCDDSTTGTLIGARPSEADRKNGSAALTGSELHGCKYSRFFRAPL